MGMAAAGLADSIDVRIMYLASALILLAGAMLVLVLPGLRQEGAEWRRALSLLRGAPAAPGLGSGRGATIADLDLLVGLFPSLSALTAKERDGLLRQATIVEAREGTTLLYHGEAGDSAYFILAGRAIAGIALPDGNYRSLSSMIAGDFYGEIAALTGAARTADVVASEAATLMRVPAQALRNLMNNPALSRLFLAKMSERLNRTTLNELPRFSGYDQQVMLDLRTAPVEEGLPK
jgi:CRP-like cAMP-binding protein